jgi:hypothetical protein
MRRHGNGGEALLNRVEEGARAVGEGVGSAFGKVREYAVDSGGRAVGYTREHPLATITTLAAGVGLGLILARMFQR